jgi:hypothetical protein
MIGSIAAAGNVECRHNPVESTSSVQLTFIPFTSVSSNRICGFNKVILSFVNA